MTQTICGCIKRYCAIEIEMNSLNSVRNQIYSFYKVNEMHASCEPFIKPDKNTSNCACYFMLYTPMTTQMSFVLCVTKTLNYNHLTDILTLNIKKNRK